LRHCRPQRPDTAAEKSLDAAAFASARYSKLRTLDRGPFEARFARTLGVTEHLRMNSCKGIVSSGSRVLFAVWSALSA